MNDEQVRDALKPHASGVHVHHPLREDTPELTPDQENFLVWARDCYDAVTVDAVRPDGLAWVIAWRGAAEYRWTLSRDGIPC